MDAAVDSIRPGARVVLTITHRFPLERGADAFAAAARREGLKVLVEP